MNRVDALFRLVRNNVSGIQYLVHPVPHMVIAACGLYLSTLIGGDRQVRVLENNLALQVGAESPSALIGGFLAAILIPLPLITYGVVAILGGLLLITYRKKDPTL